MKKLIFCIALFVWQNLVLAQASPNEKVAATQMTVSKKYAPKMLEDYRENAKTKVEELYSYFQMLTDASLTDDFKKEVVKNIQQVFNNQNPEVIDFTTNVKDKILLNALLDKLLYSEPMLFKVSENTQSTVESAVSWNSVYSVAVTKSGMTQNVTVTQQVYLFETVKTFGSATKMVTVSFLGKMD